MNGNIILAEIIRIVHIGIILFVIFGPLSPIPAILILHITFCICLLVHWHGNSDHCSLSLIESNLRGIEYNECFSHQFISPIYNISDKWVSKLCYIITYIALFLSIYFLYNSDRWTIVNECYAKTKEYININNEKINFIQKVNLYIDCFQLLFI